MRILVTGGTGFIGARLALKALREGYTVRILGQTNNAFEEQNRTRVEGQGGEVMLGSLTDVECVRAAVRGIDHVYHLAAAQHEVSVPHSHFWNVNVEGTRRLLEAAADAGVGRFVHGSTIGIYGSAASGEIDEDTPGRPDNIYGATKYEGEQAALAWNARLPVTVVRISETYGPSDRRLLKLFRALQKRRFIMIGNGANLHQPIYVDDLAEGLLQAAGSEQARGGVFILAANERLTTDRMVATIAYALGINGKMLRAPMWPFLTTAVALEHALRPLGLQPPLHRRRIDFFRKSFCFSIEKARAAFGFDPPTSFEDGVARTAKWYKENGEL